jgi:hypothetical protein
MRKALFCSVSGERGAGSGTTGREKRGEVRVEARKEVRKRGIWR